MDRISTRHMLRAALLTVCALGLVGATARAVEVSFDLPDTIECRDATPPEFAANHPTRKVIEARLRISARIVEGSESEVVDFLYMIASPDRTIRIQDYLPNTLLESEFVDDNIEVTQATEDSKNTGAEAHVAYQVFGLGANKSKGSKKTESNHYKQIAPKALVLASGTTDREHGVFFKLRPSKTASLEGAKEFTFLATVPRSWRGDWCTISCAARANKKSFFTTSIVTAGVEQTQVGLYLAGDGEAALLGEELRRVQEAHAAVLGRQLANDRDRLLDTMYGAASTHYDYAAALCGIFRCKKAGKSTDPVADAHRAVTEVQDRLRRLAE
jgi:hypothetical protein